jgi:hypothetical protein
VHIAYAIMYHTFVQRPIATGLYVQSDFHSFVCWNLISDTTYEYVPISRVLRAWRRFCEGGIGYCVSLPIGKHSRCDFDELSLLVRARRLWLHHS